MWPHMKCGCYERVRIFLYCYRQCSDKGNHKHAMSGIGSCCYIMIFMQLTHLPKKWPPFCRRHFQMHFHHLKVLYFYSNFTEISAEGSDWRLAIIGPGNGLAPTRRQAITWTNAAPIQWGIYAAGDELTLREVWWSIISWTVSRSYSHDIAGVNLDLWSMGYCGRKI